MKYEIFLHFFLLLTLFLCYAKCNNTNPEDVDDFQQTSMMLENAEMRIKTALKSVLKQSLPYLMRIFEEVNVSSPCMKSSVFFLKDLMKLKEWPLRMIDSFGKLPAGMLGIAQWISGDYDQCLDIKIPQNRKEIADKGKEQVRGKYCALTIGMQESLKRIAKSIHKLENNSLIKLAKEIIKPIKLENFHKTDIAKMKMGIRLDACIPSTCSNKDLRNVGNWIFGTAVDFNVEYCKIKDERIKYSNGQLISLIVLGIFIAWVGLATLTEILIRLHIIPLKASKGKFFEYILGASPYNSLHNLYSTNLDESTKSMCGVKFFLINIVVLGHVCLLGSFYPTVGDKYSNIFKQGELLLFEIILQGVTMIESFFFYSGFITMYLRKKSGRNSAKYYIMFLLKRIIRYTLPIFFVLGFVILLPLLGEGPHWDHIISQAKHVESEWWKYITHIQIYQNEGFTEFFNVTWFISVLLQLSILMSLLLYIVDRWPRFGKLAIIVLMLTGIIMYIVDVVSNRYYLMLEIPAAFVKSLKYHAYNYRKPYYSHLGAYCFGALIGYILGKKKQVTFKKITMLLCWIGCIVLMTLSIFGVHSYKKNIMANENIIIAFQCIAPFAWTVGFAWLTVACVTGHGGTVNRLLSLRIFVVLNSLYVWIYLLHGFIIFYVGGSMRKATGRLQFNMWMVYSFVMFLSLIAALFFFVFFESPLSSLLSKVLRNRTSQETVTSNENITEMQTGKNSKIYVV